MHALYAIADALADESAVDDGIVIRCRHIARRLQAYITSPRSPKEIIDVKTSYVDDAMYRQRHFSE